MYVVKTPLRVSLFGGGSDYPEFIVKNGFGTVLGGAINKYLYVSSIELTKGIHNFNLGFHYSKIEQVQEPSELKFVPFKNAIEYLKLSTGKEYYLMADLPAMSGLGSSSAFAVSLVKHVDIQQNLKLSNQEIANRAVTFEREVMNQVVGYQDQYFATFGGFGQFIWHSDSSFEYNRILEERMKEISQWFLLVGTNLKRVASDIAKDQVNFENLNYIKQLVDLSFSACEHMKLGNFEEIAFHLEKSWEIKKKLSSKVSNSLIDTLIYELKENGVLACKLLGAGGGGFILAMINPRDKKKISQRYFDIGVVDFEFVKDGSKVLQI